MPSEDRRISFQLTLAILLWGGNNVVTRYLVQIWPPVFVGLTRFLFAALVIRILFDYTPLLGRRIVPNGILKKKLWWKGGLNLGAYLIIFNVALVFTTSSHVALYLGTAPVWSLLMEHRPRMTRASFQAYGAAFLALMGLGILCWPAIQTGHHSVLGELLALTSSILWANFGRQSRALTEVLSPFQISYETFWRAAVFASPIALYELIMRKFQLPFTARLALLQIYCILASGVLAFYLWNRALQFWPASRVYLFNNFIPLATLFWAAIFLGEKVTSNFLLATAFIFAGVVVGQFKLPAKTVVFANEQ